MRSLYRLSFILLGAMILAACNVPLTETAPVSAGPTAANTVAPATPQMVMASPQAAGSGAQTSAGGSVGGAAAPGTAGSGNSAGNNGSASSGNSAGNSGSAGSGNSAGNSGSAGSGNSASADTAPPTVSNISNSTRGYYPAACGSTTVAFTADVVDDRGGSVKVWVSYRILSMAQGLGGTQWYRVDMSPQGNGSSFVAIVDIAAQAAAELGGQDGSLEYQIFAEDAAGNTVSVPDGSVYALDILTCGGQGSSGQGTAPTISNVSVYPQPDVYYGASCTTEETRMSVQATIEPLSEIATATVWYGYTGNAGTRGNYSVTMTQLGVGDFAADIDVGQEADLALAGGAGQVDFYISAETHGGQTVSSGWYSLSVLPCGGALGQPPQGGDAVVRFYNNASHPVVELLIDGTDVILTEAQAIPVGSYLDVTMPAGSHFYQPGAGYWDAGGKVPFYPLPSGSVDAQDGSVTITDPPLSDMVTNYGQNGYYVGYFWDANNINHCAAFDFATDGSFAFYIDGAYIESGSYALVSRDPGAYAVNFTVNGYTSGEQFPATLYYTGAMAGTLSVPNGPPGWQTIEYTLNGVCQ